jgi:uncharacterized protein
MLRRSISTTVTLVVLSAGRSQAQTIDTVPEARDAAKLALVQELVTTANFRQQLLRTMRETSVRQGSMAQVPPGFWEKFLSRAELASDTLLAPMIDDYTRYFSSADLRALIVFFRSPAGRRLSLVAPVISANSSFAGSRWGQKVGIEVATELMTPKGTTPPTSDAQAKATKKP